MENRIVPNAGSDAPILNMAFMPSGLTSCRLIRLPGFELVDHAPQAVAFPPFDDLKRSRAFKSGIGAVQPGTDVFGINQFG